MPRFETNASPLSDSVQFDLPPRRSPLPGRKKCLQKQEDFILISYDYRLTVLLS